MLNNSVWRNRKIEEKETYEKGMDKLQNSSDEEKLNQKGEDNVYKEGTLHVKDQHVITTNKPSLPPPHQYHSIRQTPTNHLATTIIQTFKTRQVFSCKTPAANLLPATSNHQHYHNDNYNKKQQCVRSHTLCRQQSTHHNNNKKSTNQQDTHRGYKKPLSEDSEEHCEPRMEGGEEKISRAWPQTAALLPVLYQHYHTHALSIHQPSHYMSEQTKETWYFTSIKQHSEHSQVELFLHMAIKNFTLVVTSTRNNSLTYEFNLDSYASQTGLFLSGYVGDDKVNLPYRTMLTAHGDWVIINITNFMKNWILNQAQFVVEIPRPMSWAKKQREELLLLQPVICIKQQKNFEKRKSDFRVRWVVKKFIPSHEEGEKPKKQMRTARAIPSDHSRARRKSINRQCHLQEVEVSLQEMGLREVEYPDTLLLRYCDGSCHVLSHPDPFSVNALLRAKFRLLWGPRPVPAPHCIPVTYQTQLLFVWREGHIILARYSDLNARTCGCR
ncbi:hypothetical protein Pmani_009831 [Petrolisthes manimaculis]|uniref:TGF-beta family profile domain-containing protein n=1 Tax=Petrolisthes manimaculis TaxID=1843537 RepID=A0AAE1UI01_9EUCA|nr:hypothetical protein Pmani_009831 [Petrolisthes manimaculis]